MTDHKEDDCECAICSGDVTPGGFIDRVMHDIQTFGCSVIGVAGGEGHQSWSYTVGATLRKQPEFVIAGIHPETAVHLLNDMFDKAQTEDFKAGDRVEKLIKSYPVVLKQVDPAKYDEFFGIGRDFADVVVEAGGVDTGILQIVWPDPNGKFQWEEGFHEPSRQEQFWTDPS